MAIRKEIEIVANTGQAERAVDDLAGSFDKVDKEAAKANKSIDDVTGNGGAIAVLDRLTGGLASQFRDAFEASKLFNGSLKATRGALIATGIGAFVVALGAVVAYWDEIVEFITESNKRLEQQLEITTKIQEVMDSELSVMESQLKLNELQGINNEELQKQQIALLELRQQQEQKEIDILERQLDRLKAQQIELTGWDKVKIAASQYLGLWGNVAQVSIDRVNEQAAAVAELEAKLNGARKNALDLSIQLFNVNNPAATTGEQDTTQRGQVSSVGGLNQADVDPLQDPEVLLAQQKISLIEEAEAGLTQFLMDEYKKRKQAEEVQSEAKIGLARNTENLLYAIAERGSSFAKGLAVANIVREQIQGASAAISNLAVANTKAAAASPLTAGQPWVAINTASTIAGIAAGAVGAGKAIKDILSDSKSPQNYGGNLQGGGGAQAPSFNLVEGTGENQIQNTLQNQDRPIQAYVVSEEVTTRQSLDRRRTSQAALG